MDIPSVLEGEARAEGLRFTIVASRFNERVVERLIEGAAAELARLGAGAEQVELLRVPGAFDLPVVARRVAVTGRADAIIALGAVIRGTTPHFEFVASECASGLQRVATDTGVPVAFGVLTTDDLAQADERAGGGAGNRGADAAQAAVRLASLLRRLGP